MLAIKAGAVLAILLAPISLAAQVPGDTVDVHISASRWSSKLSTNNTYYSFERVNAVISGKKLELTAGLSGPDLLIPGDYRARFVSQKNESPDEVRQTYEILLPNNRSRTFDVTGIRE